MSAPQLPDGWLRAIDEELVSTHLGVANATDSYETAKKKLNELISWHIDVAKDPAVNGGINTADTDLIIQDDTELLNWINTTLEEVRTHTLPEKSQRCPHCALNIRFPVMARKSDVEMFVELVRSANRVMKSYGILGYLLAEIKAECILAIAKRESKKKEGEN